MATKVFFLLELRMNTSPNHRCTLRMLNTWWVALSGRCICHDFPPLCPARRNRSNVVVKHKKHVCEAFEAVVSPSLPFFSTVIFYQFDRCLSSMLCRG